MIGALMIYHICKKSDWDKANKSGEYRAESLLSQGFIHCSTLLQVSRVLATFYQGQSGLVLLVIDPKQLASPVKWEPGTDKPDELFPHVFGPINTDAVGRVVAVHLNEQGSFEDPILE